MSASIWFGGYVVLFFIVLPKAKRDKNPEFFIEFEQSFQKIGFPALLTQFVTGPILAMHFYSNPIDWFKFQTPHQDHIASKIIFLFIIVILVLRTRRNTVPRLRAGDPKAMKSAKWITGWIMFLAFSNIMMGMSVNTNGFSY
ncbi:MAG: hypothetical protein GY747_04520 [Planctomycetes bacterium]|nr:hypothetical protein [Planctomycetota bacterium]MCP4771479.1 hypothetical protein [Planctomycetota bacterium]MCP4861140.1 hypothetical protein [Planctomycetota bacterium]